MHIYLIDESHWWIDESIFPYLIIFNWLTVANLRDPIYQKIGTSWNRRAAPPVLHCSLWFFLVLSWIWSHINYSRPYRPTQAQAWSYIHFSWVWPYTVCRTLPSRPKQRRDTPLGRRKEWLFYSHCQPTDPTKARVFRIICVLSCRRTTLRWFRKLWSISTSPGFLLNLCLCVV